MAGAALPDLRDHFTADELAQSAERTLATLNLCKNDAERIGMLAGALEAERLCTRAHFEKLFTRVDELQAQLATLNSQRLSYRGVFDHSESYDPGDVVTHAGSCWHCADWRGLAPGSPDSGWALMVKRGRDGKDAA